jgi:predicted metal-binding protein
MGMKMKTFQQLESLFREHNFTDFKWINPNQIIVAQWVRMKCLFGCNEYGKCGTCPPNTPTVPECERFFLEYSGAVIFHFKKTVSKPEDRFQWTRETDLKLLDLEREVFIAGFPKAFLLFMDSCNLCQDCTGTKLQCKNPKAARPSPEAMAVDVFSTVKQIGYPIEVLSEYSQRMNRYAFLMID